ncbi:hypothetical protein HUA74_19835 [Myxococcus sp. CA051A]|uniref:LVIVD repeat-containing protein n=1 Tax=Myxococcus sp. CA051A TaxID=2741739 RepID=UPI00157B9F52|nr:hypothetical protein [Myxococcus sp. CA051A]NTX62903.1 hypothetical protein [Myxococcus sp. CA051A]
MKTLSLSPGAWRSLCVLLPALLSACGGSSAPGVDAGPQPDDAGTPDAGPPPWDGTATALEDLGDWVDTGRYDACQFINPESLDPLLCESLTAFDSSSCSAQELSGVEGRGIYQVNLRGEMRVRANRPTTTTVSRSAISIGLHDDGTPDALGSGPVIARVTEGGTFFLTGRRALATPEGDIITTASFAGCHVPSPGVITGCYVSCSSDARFGKTLGTFVAHRMTWAAGEGESSGGLSLMSEAATSVGRPADLFVAKEHAYVVSLDGPPRVGGLSVFDVRDRRNPVLKKTVSLAGDTSWNGVWARGDALYIASNSSGLVIFDISDPANPVFVRRAEGPHTVHTVLVDADRLYANAPGTGTYVYDVSKPLEPTLLQIVTPTPGGFSSGPHDVFAYQGRLYISNAESGFSIMDITDLNDVRHLGDYFRPDAISYAHHSAVGTFAGRTIAFEGGEFNGSHVRVLDVTDPANIVLIGTHRMRPVVSMHNLLLRGQLLYVAWYHEGLRVLDVSNPTQPRQVAHFNTFRETDPGRSHGVFEGNYGVRIPGDGYVYLVDSVRGLVIVNEL